MKLQFLGVHVVTVRSYQKPMNASAARKFQKSAKSLKKSMNGVKGMKGAAALQIQMLSVLFA